MYAVGQQAAFGVGLLMAALPNALGLPRLFPGLALLMAIPQLFLALQAPASPLAPASLSRCRPSRLRGGRHLQDEEEPASPLALPSRAAVPHA